MLRKNPPTRKQRLDAALALAGVSFNEFAEQSEVTRQHLYLVAMGQRESASLTAKIDAFIAEHTLGAPDGGAGAPAFQRAAVA